jgi:transcriptional regulator with XRE-family HTH domain
MAIIGGSDRVLNHQVAAEIRAELARQQRSQSSLAAELGWTQIYLSRRLREEVGLSLDDIDAIAAVLEISILALMHPHGSAV